MKVNLGCKVYLKYVEFVYHINESEFKLQCVIIIICVKTIKVKTVILVLDP